MFEGCLTGRAPPNCEPSLALSHMLRGSCTSECAPTSELSCMLRGSRSLTLRPHLGAIPRVPRVVYSQVAPPHRSYLACFEGRAPAISLSLWGLPACPESRVPAHCALTSELFHMLQGSRALKLRTDSGAISHFPRVAYLLIALSVCGSFEFSGVRLISGFRAVFARAKAREKVSSRAFARLRAPPKSAARLMDKGFPLLGKKA